MKNKKFQNKPIIRIQISQIILLNNVALYVIVGLMVTILDVIAQALREGTIR